MHNILTKVRKFWSFRRASRNQRKYLSSLNELEERASHYPVELFLETTNACNISCIMCVGRHRIERATKELDFRLIEKLNPFIARASAIHPFGYGEPAIYPDFVRLLRFIRSTNPATYISFVTNGQLYDEDKIEAIVETAVDTIVFSIDSVDPSIYASIRRGATLDKAVEAIDRLREIKASRGLTRPGLRIETVLMKNNIDYIDDVLSFCVDKQIEMLLLEKVRLCPDLEPDNYEAYADLYLSVARGAAEAGVQLVGPFVEEYRRFFYPQANKTGTAASKNEETRSPIPCLSPWSTMYVRCDGLVLTCCVDSPVLGDLNKEDPRDIWNGSRYRELRKGILSGKFTEECARCISQGRHMMSPLPLPPLERK